MPILSSFAKTLRKVRTKAGMSQEALSFEAELSRNFIGELERKLKEPSITTLFKISKALKMPASEFVALMEKRISKR